MKDNLFKKMGLAVKNEFSRFFTAIRFSDWKTRLSLVFMGAGNILRGQIAKGAFYLAFEALFIWYITTRGSYWISMLPSLGKVGPGNTYDEFFDTYVYTYNDNSFQILLYGILTIFLIIAFVYTWRSGFLSAYEAQKLEEKGKKVNKLVDDLRSLVDEKFYKTLLSLPLLGITVFTVLPIVFMVMVAFTNYDAIHDGYVTSLFTWVGWENFKTMFSFEVGGYGKIFFSVLGWTLVWAFFATFSNYFLGILTALMINKKGIRFKKMWRTIFVLTIAIPQFISLLYVAKMFDKGGLVNGLLLKWNWITEPIAFWDTPWIARLLVIVINIWIGIPYLMLIATGILMNIPEDLYESAKIDGATPAQQFFHITMPYMLFITGPYLLTSFTANMNNFNVIYLLSAGGPTKPSAATAVGAVGDTDLLITWLFKITQGSENKYYMASVVGIMVFIVVAVITLLVYNLLPSNRNEEDMQ